MTSPGRPLGIALAGAGRMGRAIADVAAASGAVELAGIWARDPATVEFGGVAASDDLERVVANADVVVDFSLPEGTMAVIQACQAHSTPLVCGVSGLDDGQFERLEAAARELPVVYDRNMSQGVAVLQGLVRRAVTALGPDFEVTIHEVHHAHKQDAPSGTALKLGETVARARGKPLRDVYWYQPDAGDRAAAAGDIRFEVERRGEVAGEHSVILASATETLRLEHSVTTRRVFAEGAIRAARWVAGRRAGLYSMQDVLSITG